MYNKNLMNEIEKSISFPKITLRIRELSRKYKAIPFNSLL